MLHLILIGDCSGPDDLRGEVNKDRAEGLNGDIERNRQGSNRLIT